MAFRTNRDLNKKKVDLDDEQHRVVELVRRRRSVLVTGPAGTGKSAILAELQLVLPVTVTATTGLAAINVCGSTIHSWSGIGVDTDPEVIMDKLKPYTKDRIRACDYLAIDEISMMGATMMDLLDFILQQVRCSSEPFGGLTLIMFGDFFQLPPVGDLEFAFQSDAWQNLNPEVVQLTRIYRQLDPAFQKMLNGVRYGKPDPDSMNLLASRINAPDSMPDRVPVKLYPTNRDVDHENRMMLDLIKDQELHTFDAVDFASHPVQLGILKKNCRWPEELELKIGARIMLLLNHDVENGLANGSMGLVTGFRDAGWEDEEGKVRDLAVLVSFDIAPDQIIPIEREKFEVKAVESSSGRWVSKVVASREQFPLRLAYAITIHKSQGMSLDKVKIYLASCFEAGQAYVALSRARTLEGLYIGDFGKGCIRASRKAKEFYKALTDAA